MLGAVAKKNPCYYQVTLKTGEKVIVDAVNSQKTKVWVKDAKDNELGSFEVAIDSSQENIIEIVPDSFRRTEDNSYLIFTTRPFCNGYYSRGTARKADLKTGEVEILHDSGMGLFSVIKGKYEKSQFHSITELKYPLFPVPEEFKFKLKLTMS